MSEFDELRRLAQAATPGPWLNLSHSGSWEWWLKRDTGDWEGDVLCIFEDGEVHSEPSDADMDFIAAANPEAIIRLLDEHAAEVEKLMDLADERVDQNAELLAQEDGLQSMVNDLRADLAAANARADDAAFFRDQFKAALNNLADRDREHMEKIAAERDRLQARIDKALALVADEWALEVPWIRKGEVRAALAADTPTTAAAEPPVDWVADLSQGIRDQMCVCGHTRDMHACTFASVQCICGCAEFRYGTATAEGSDQ